MTCDRKIGPFDCCSVKQLKKYMEFRRLWKLEGDMMHPEDLKMARERLARLSDELEDYENGNV